MTTRLHKRAEYVWTDGPPEKLNERMASRERIEGAIKLFEENFDQDGKPKTKEGRILAKKYEKRYYPYRAPSLLVWRLKLRHWIKSVFKKSNRK